MNISQAADFLRRLLAGADPDTGEVLPEDHLLQRADVREALLTALQAMGAQETWGELPLTRSGCLNASRPWTQEDLADLQALYGSGMPIEEIARLIHRRPRGVRLQLNLLAGGGYGRGERVAIPERKGEDVSDRRGTRWMPADDDALTAAYHEGVDLKQLAKDFGRSPYAMEMRLRKLGLLPDEDVPEECPAEPEAEVEPPVLISSDVAAAISPSRRWTEEDDACLRRAWARGDDVERIVRLMGRRDRLVRCRLIFLGLAPRSLLGGEELPPELAHQGLPWYPEEISALQRMFRQGCSDEQMAAELRRSVAAVRSRMDILNLTDAAADEPHA